MEEDGGQRGLRCRRDGDGFELPLGVGEIARRERSDYGFLIYIDLFKLIEESKLQQKKISETNYERF